MIHIAVSKNKEHIILSVEDNGKGIAENEIAIIFDMYGRLHKEVEGQGIGLYLAKKIINSADGNIVVESEVGRGTKFIIYLKNEILEENTTVLA